MTTGKPYPKEVIQKIREEVLKGKTKYRVAKERILHQGEVFKVYLAEKEKEEERMFPFFFNQSKGVYPKRFRYTFDRLQWRESH